ncbi:hypothetical protein [Aeromonas phage Aer_P220]|uniref:Uncharacterized protein n=1 Tax=Aeromonas phage Aer_P220 TaxID=2951227 RepID=A0A9E7T0V9_9CAUD|nr:hypothetical protein [Aeromonas phage Aer_P220]
MKFDKTCCGTTCDAKANAEYVAKLESVILEVYSILQDNYYPRDIGYEVQEWWERNESFLIKHAQQNNSTNGAS